MITNDFRCSLTGAVLNSSKTNLALKQLITDVMQYINYAELAINRSSTEVSESGIYSKPVLFIDNKD